MMFEARLSSFLKRSPFPFLDPGGSLLSYFVRPPERYEENFLKALCLPFLAVRQDWFSFEEQRTMAGSIPAYESAPLSFLENFHGYLTALVKRRKFRNYRTDAAWFISASLDLTDARIKAHLFEEMKVFLLDRDIEVTDEIDWKATDRERLAYSNARPVPDAVRKTFSERYPELFAALLLENGILLPPLSDFEHASTFCGDYLKNPILSLSRPEQAVLNAVFLAMASQDDRIFMTFLKSRLHVFPDHELEGKISRLMTEDEPLFSLRLSDLFRTLSGHVPFSLFPFFALTDRFFPIETKYGPLLPVIKKILLPGSLNSQAFEDPEKKAETEPSPPHGPAASLRGMPSMQSASSRLLKFIRKKKKN